MQEMSRCRLKTCTNEARWHEVRQRIANSAGGRAISESVGTKTICIAIRRHIISMSVYERLNNIGIVCERHG
jgi:hypothetical protein